MERSIHIESVDGANLELQGTYGVYGKEKPNHRLVIVVDAKFVHGVNCKFEESPDSVKVAIFLEIPQVAQIVKGFFKPVCRDKNGIFRSFLFRLLRRRWSAMTVDFAKKSKEWPMPKYYNLNS